MPWERARMPCQDGDGRAAIAVALQVCNCRTGARWPGRPGLSGVSTMRGRDEDLRIASELLGGAERGHGAERGQGNVLLIEGDPGIGKTGLLGEIMNEPGRRRFPVARGEADDLGRRSPFAPLLTALQDAGGGRPGETSTLSAPESWA